MSKQDKEPPHYQDIVTAHFSALRAIFPNVAIICHSTDTVYSAIQVRDLQLFDAMVNTAKSEIKTNEKT